MAYLIGQEVRIGNHATDPATGQPTSFLPFTTGGIAVDPTTVTLTVKAPDRAITTPPVTREATGRYYADVTLDQPGRWSWRLEGDGAVQAPAEGVIVVDRSRVLS